MFFSSDVANPDTYTAFLRRPADVHDDDDAAGSRACSCASSCPTEVATKANKWQGRNITRWRNAEYDKLFHDAENELDPVKRAALFIAMNDLVIKNVVVIPVVTAPGVSRGVEQAACAAERLGQQLLGFAGLVPRCLTPVAWQRRPAPAPASGLSQRDARA